VSGCEWEVQLFGAAIAALEYADHGLPATKTRFDPDVDRIRTTISAPPPRTTEPPTHSRQPGRNGLPRWSAPPGAPPVEDGDEIVKAPGQRYRRRRSLRGPTQAERAGNSSSYEGCDTARRWTRALQVVPHESAHPLGAPKGGGVQLPGAASKKPHSRAHEALRQASGRTAVGAHRPSRPMAGQGYSRLKARTVGRADRRQQADVIDRCRSLSALAIAVSGATGVFRGLSLKHMLGREIVAGNDDRYRGQSGWSK